MSIQQLIYELNKSGNHEIYSVARDEDIAITENLIESRLPHSYIYFVKYFSNGAYLYRTQEICSVGKSNKKIQSIHDLYKLNKNMNTPIYQYEGKKIVPINELIPYSLDSNGNAWCFFKMFDKVCYLDRFSDRFFGQLEGFDKWLSILIQSKDEVIRSIYSKKIIMEELKLG